MSGSLLFSFLYKMLEKGLHRRSKRKVFERPADLPSVRDSCAEHLIRPSRAKHVTGRVRSENFGNNPLPNDCGGAVPQGQHMAVPGRLDGVVCSLIFGRQGPAIQKWRYIVTWRR